MRIFLGRGCRGFFGSSLGILLYLFFSPPIFFFVVLQETFAIQDLIRYYSSTYDSQVNTNLSLPTNYEIKFILNSNSGGDPNVCYLRFDSSSGGYVGKGSSTNRTINCSPINQNISNIATSTDVEYTLTKENGVLTLTDGTTTITGNTNDCTSLNHLKGSTNGKIKNIRVKAL